MYRNCPQMRQWVCFKMPKILDIAFPATAHLVKGLSYCTDDYDINNHNNNKNNNDNLLENFILTAQVKNFLLLRNPKCNRSYGAEKCLPLASISS